MVNENSPNNELKKDVLLRLQEILKQTENLQIELNHIVELNKRLSLLDPRKINRLLKNFDPKIAKLQKSFELFVRKNLHKTDQELQLLHEKIKEHIQTQIDHIIRISDIDNNIPVEKSLIDQYTQSLKREPSTLMGIESMLIQRNINNFVSMDLSILNKHLNTALTCLEQKEQTITKTVNIINSLHPPAENSEQFRQLLEYIQQGGSLNTLEEKFDIKTIEMATEAYTDEPDHEVSNIVLEDDHYTPLNQVKNADKTSVSGMKQFFRIFKLWINTPRGVSWQQAKKSIMKN